jgi:uncharacterized protein YutE (UPF0331/DUF86 family)
MIDKNKITKYLENIQRQLEDLVPNAEFFLQRRNFERTKAIKYSLLNAIEDVIHISMHIVVVKGLGKPRDAASAILLLSTANILPASYAQQIVGMVNFRNSPWRIHEYIPNEFEADRLFENLHRLDDFRQFSKYILEFLERIP